tara:strand:- start:566 stop:814 length:249 start_codon:yes stop_codon:yes gene_type:complete
MSIQILCANDEKLIVDPTSLANVPPVLARLLGLREGFAKCEQIRQENKAAEMKQTEEAKKRLRMAFILWRKRKSLKNIISEN